MNCHVERNSTHSGSLRKVWDKNIGSNTSNVFGGIMVQTFMTCIESFNQHQFIEKVKEEP